MKKGFTLIELLAVIAILAIIMLIATPHIMDAIENSRIESLKADKNMVIKATETYFGNNVDLLPENLGDTIEVSLAQLQTSKLIGNIKSPFNSDNCDGYILVTKTNDSYVYSPEINCINNTKNSKVLDSLIGYWKFDNISGLLDLSGNGNAAIAQGGLVLGNEIDQKGNTGGATSFDGIDDYIELGTVTGNYQEHTISIWGRNWFSLEDVTTFQGFELAVSNAVIAHNLEDDVTGADSLSTYDEPLVGWNHIVTTYNSDYIKFYLNGKLVYTKQRGNIPLDASPFFNINRLVDLGLVEETLYGTSAEHFLEGMVSEVRIYNRKLSDEEIKMLYETTK